MNKQTLYIIIGTAVIVGAAAFFILRSNKKVIKDGTFHITINTD